MSSENAWLECSATGLRLPLPEFAIIGRGQAVRVRVKDGGVSREHASLRCRDGAWWLQDMGSANGTFVNGLPVMASIRVRDADEISFGPAKYVFRNPGSTGKTVVEDHPEMTIVGRALLEKAQVTMLVADVVGFSELSTRLPAEEISGALSSWCGHCRAVMHDCGGHIDKFIGDCVFAWWHGTGEDVKRLALRAADALAGPRRENILSDGSILRCGTGLHCGEAMLSRLGPASYTILGADVNLAFRLESLTRTLEPLITSREFATGWEEGGDWVFPSLGTHKIKGWPQPVEVHAVRPFRGGAVDFA